MNSCAGYLLGRVVKKYKSQVKLRGWPQKVPSDQLWSWRFGCVREAFYVFAFLAACHFLKSETRSLFNFFLSSFVCPMLRFCIPQVMTYAHPALRGVGGLPPLARVLRYPHHV